MKTTYFASYDVKIPNSFLSLMYAISERMTAAETAVLLDLLQRGALNHEIPLSITQIMHDCNISRPTACNALKRLRKRGVIDSTHTAGARTPAQLAIVNADQEQYTIIPKTAFNTCFELIRGGGISYTALRLLIFVWRNTYGFRGKNGNSETPSSMFSDSFMCKGLGINRGNLNRAVKELVKVGAIRFNGRFKDDFGGDYDIIFRKGWAIKVKRFTAQNEDFARTARFYLQRVKDDTAIANKFKGQELPCCTNLTSDAVNSLPDDAVYFLPVDRDGEKGLETSETLENQGETAENQGTGKNYPSKVYTAQHTFQLKTVVQNITEKTGLSPDFEQDPIVENVESLKNKADEESETEEPKRPKRKPITIDEWLSTFTDEEKEATSRQREAIENVTKSNLEYLQEPAATGYNFMDILHYAEQHGGSLQGFEKYQQGGQANE